MKKAAKISREFSIELAKCDLDDIEISLISMIEFGTTNSIEFVVLVKVVDSTRGGRFSIHELTEDGFYCLEDSFFTHRKHLGIMSGYYDAIEAYNNEVERYKRIL